MRSKLQDFLHNTYWWIRLLFKKDKKSYLLFSRNLGIKPDILCECSDENSIQALVREQFGIALVARVDILNDKYLKIHRISDVDLVHYVNIAWLKNHYLMPATKRFIDFMISGSDLDSSKIKSIT